MRYHYDQCLDEPFFYISQELKFTLLKDQEHHIDAPSPSFKFSAKNEGPGFLNIIASTEERDVFFTMTLVAGNTTGLAPIFLSYPTRNIKLTFSTPSIYGTKISLKLERD